MTLLWSRITVAVPEWLVTPDANMVDNVAVLQALACEWKKAEHFLRKLAVAGVFARYGRDEVIRGEKRSVLVEGPFPDKRYVCAVDGCLRFVPALETPSAVACLHFRRRYGRRGYLCAVCHIELRGGEQLFGLRDKGAS